MLNNKTVFSLLLIISLFSNVFLGYLYSNDPGASKSDAADDNARVTETIKLYSNGKLVDKWEGVGKGQLENGTYTFRVGEGAFHTEVRINGTFSVERSDK